MKIVLDTSVLIYLVYPSAPAPNDPSTSVPVSHCQERIEGLLEDLSKMDAQLIIPTPVLSELLIRAHDRQAEILAILTNRRAVTIAAFDMMAAVENATFRRNKGLSSAGRSETKKEVSFDLQILAIARAQQADRILSDDKSLRERAKKAGFTVVGIAEIPVPDSKRQIAMALPSVGVRNSPDEDG